MATQRWLGKSPKVEGFEHLAHQNESLSRVAGQVSQAVESKTEGEPFIHPDSVAPETLRKLQVLAIHNPAVKACLAMLSLGHPLAECLVETVMQQAEYIGILERNELRRLQNQLQPANRPPSEFTAGPDGKVYDKLGNRTACRHCGCFNMKSRTACFRCGREQWAGADMFAVNGEISLSLHKEAPKPDVETFRSPEGRWGTVEVPLGFATMGEVAEAKVKAANTITMCCPKCERVLATVSRETILVDATWPDGRRVSGPIIREPGAWYSITCPCGEQVRLEEAPYPDALLVSETISPQWNDKPVDIKAALGAMKERALREVGYSPPDPEVTRNVLAAMEYARRQEAEKEPEPATEPKAETWMDRPRLL